VLIAYVYFLTSMKFALKLLEKSSRVIRMSHLKRQFFNFLPHILSLCKLGNDQSKKKINDRYLLARQKFCMPPGIKQSFEVTPQFANKTCLFYQERSTSYRLPKIVLFTAQTKHFFDDVYWNKQRWVVMLSNPHNFDKRILFQSNTLFQSRMEYGGHIPLAETYPIPEVFLPKQTRVHAPWVLVISPNHSRSSGRWTGDWWDIPCVKRPFRDGIWLFAMCEWGNESWSMSLNTLPSWGKHITLKSEETIAPMQ